MDGSGARSVPADEVPNPEQANQRNLLTTTSTQGGPADVFNKATKPHHHPKEAVVPGKATPAAIPTTPLPNSNEAGIFKRRSNTTTHLLKPKTQESAINPKPLPELQESGTATPKRKRAPLDPKQAQTTATNPPSTPTASTASITEADKHRGLLSIHDGPANALDSASKKHRIRDAPRSTTPPPKPTSGETQHKPLTPPATPTKTAPTTTPGSAPGSAPVRPLRPNHGAGPAKSGPQESGPADVFNKATRKHHHAKGSEETPLPGKTTGMPAVPGSRNLLQWGGWGSGAMSQAQAQSQSMGGMSQSQAQAQSMSMGGGMGGWGGGNRWGGYGGWGRKLRSAQEVQEAQWGGYGGYGGFGGSNSWSNANAAAGSGSYGGPFGGGSQSWAQAQASAGSGSWGRKLRAASKDPMAL